MIILTRLDGQVVAINCDLVERVDAAVNTTITLVDGSVYTVLERVPEIIEKIREFRASIVTSARRFESGERRSPHLRLLDEIDASSK